MASNIENKFSDDLKTTKFYLRIDEKFLLLACDRYLNGNQELPRNFCFSKIRKLTIKVFKLLIFSNNSNIPLKNIIAYGAVYIVGSRRIFHAQSKKKQSQIFSPSIVIVKIWLQSISVVDYMKH